MMLHIHKNITLSKANSMGLITPAYPSDTLGVIVEFTDGSRLWAAEGEDISTLQQLSLTMEIMREELIRIGDFRDSMLLQMPNRYKH